MPRVRERLTWRTSMDGIEPVQREVKRVGPMELEGVAWAVLDIYAYNIEARTMVANCRAACATEQVE